jgi:Na+-driven multidrug efflux pump
MQHKHKHKHSIDAMAGESAKGDDEPARPKPLQAGRLFKATLLAASGDSDASSNIFHRSWHEEARLQLVYAVPLVLSMALQQVQVIVILAMLNSVTPQRENTTVLGGVGIAVMIINATGYYWIMGLSGGLETLSSQLFGQGQHDRIGLALQTALVVIGALSAPVAIIWWYLGDLLEAVGVDPGQSQVAGRFAR